MKSPLRALFPCFRRGQTCRQQKDVADIMFPRTPKEFAHGQRFSRSRLSSPIIVIRVAELALAAVFKGRSAVPARFPPI